MSNEPQDTVISIDGSGNIQSSVLQDHGHQIVDASTGEAAKPIVDAFGRNAVKSHRRMAHVKPLDVEIEMLPLEDFEKEAKKFKNSKVLGPYILLVRSLIQSVSNMRAITDTQKTTNKTLRDENATLKEEIARLTSPEYRQTLREQIEKELTREKE
jgi:hypothetical protein